MSIYLSSYAKKKDETTEMATILEHVGGSLKAKNMHLWRGQEVSSEFTAATEVYFKTKNDMLRIGLWNGMGVTGKFKEIDYFVTFKYEGLEASFWDIYNFSTNATYNNKQAFNYKARETGHFFDLRLSYQFQKKFPLKIFWSTLLFGRDRGLLNEKNRYSTYIELEYPFFSYAGFNLSAGVGGAFAFRKGLDLDGEKSRANFYGSKPNIVDIHLKLDKIFKIGSYKLPVYFMPVWNPEGDYFNMEVAVELLSF